MVFILLKWWMYCSVNHLPTSLPPPYLPFPLSFLLLPTLLLLKGEGSRVAGFEAVIEGHEGGSVGAGPRG